MEERRVWIDLANAPHVLVCAPIIERLRSGGWDVVLTARPHAGTVELASLRWSDVTVVGEPSPPGPLAKGSSIVRRARALARFVRSARPAVALSHGSYAQIVAARTARIPVVTMMDYEHQPANHLSFRLAHRVLVPAAFPTAALRKYGASEERVRRYDGFKEQLYLAGFAPDGRLLEKLGIAPDRVTVVFRTPPDGALYHRGVAGRFDEIVQSAVATEGVTAVLVPRNGDQGSRYASSNSVVIPPQPLDTLSLLACADAVVGGGGTMTRESALLGTPTYTVFAGELAAVDAELIRCGKLLDLRHGSAPRFAKRSLPFTPVPAEPAERILDTVLEAVRDVAAG
jgi:predicted glycosyltransferase